VDVGEDANIGRKFSISSAILICRVLICCSIHYVADEKAAFLDAFLRLIWATVSLVRS